jgi:hypothetical protein
MNQCDGCRTFEYLKTIEKLCILSNAPKKMLLCPCKTCLLKSICQQGCKDFFKLSISIFKIKLYYDYKSYYYNYYGIKPPRYHLAKI